MNSINLEEESEEVKDYGLYGNAANQPDEYVRCPYFPQHELRRSRLPYHIIKCQTNPRAPKLVICPYNFMHRSTKEEMKKHLINCADRIGHKYSERKPPTAKQIETSAKINMMKSNTIKESEEDW